MSRSASHSQPGDLLAPLAWAAPPADTAAFAHSEAALVVAARLPPVGTAGRVGQLVAAGESGVSLSATIYWNEHSARVLIEV